MQPGYEKIIYIQKQYSLLETILLKLIIEYYEYRLNRLLTSIRALKEPDAPRWLEDAAKITEETLLERYLDYDIYKELLYQLEHRDESALQKYVEDEKVKTIQKVRDFWPPKYRLPDWVK